MVLGEKADACWEAKAGYLASAVGSVGAPESHIVSPKPALRISLLPPGHPAIPSNVSMESFDCVSTASTSLDHP